MILIIDTVVFPILTDHHHHHHTVRIVDRIYRVDGLRSFSSPYCMGTCCMSSIEPFERQETGQPSSGILEDGEDDGPIVVAVLSTTL